MLRKKIRSLSFFAFFSLLPAVGFAAEEATVDTGITSWMLVSTALVLLMVPGLAMFYGGLVRTKNVLGTMMHAFAAMSIIEEISEGMMIADLVAIIASLDIVAPEVDR